MGLVRGKDFALHMDNPPVYNGRGILELSAVTLAASSLDEAVQVYGRFLGYELVWEGEVTGDQARGWGAPHLRGRRMVALRAPCEEHGGVRFVEVGDGLGERDLLRGPGWSALELTVAELDVLVGELEAGPFQILSAPADLPFDNLAAGLRAAQVRGPFGEALYLTEVIGQTETLQLPVPASGSVGRVFVAVLGSSEYDAACAFIGDVLGMEFVLESKIPLQGRNAVLGLPPETNWLLSAYKAEGPFLIEIDRLGSASANQVQIETSKRWPLPVTLEVADVEKMMTRLAQWGIPCRLIADGGDESLYCGAPGVVVDSPGGGSLEFVQQGESRKMKGWAGE